MVGLAQVALNSAPILGGALLATAAGQFRGPDYRDAIKQDLELLDRLAPEDTARRAELRRTIEDRIDDLIDAADRTRALRRAALSYHGNWRDGVLLLCAVLFTIIWWNVSHSRDNWLPMFVALILLCAVAAAYAFRGAVRASHSVLRGRGGKKRRGRDTGAAG